MLSISRSRGHCSGVIYYENTFVLEKFVHYMEVSTIRGSTIGRSDCISILCVTFQYCLRSYIASCRDSRNNTETDHTWAVSAVEAALRLLAAAHGWNQCLPKGSLITHGQSLILPLGSVPTVHWWCCSRPRVVSFHQSAICCLCQSLLGMSLPVHRRLLCDRQLAECQRSKAGHSSAEMPFGHSRPWRPLDWGFWIRQRRNWTGLRRWAVGVAARQKRSRSDSRSSHAESGSCQRPLPTVWPFADRSHPKTPWPESPAACPNQRL